MKENDILVAVMASDVPARSKRTSYPQPFASMVAGREKQVLGDIFGITNFGVNLTRLAPGSQSALLHKHTLQQEFIYILQGQPTLVTETGDIQLRPGMCAGFTAEGTAHQLVNHTVDDVVYLEIGDRSQGDQASYPADDLMATMGSDGQWHFTHKDGKPY